MGLRGTANRALGTIREHMGDRALGAVVEFINAVSKVLEDFPFTGQGWKVTEATDIAATTDKLILHNLGRKPIGYFPIKIEKHSVSAFAIPKWTTGVTTSYDSTKHINIHTDVACRMTFLVF